MALLLLIVGLAAGCHGDGRPPEPAAQEEPAGAASPAGYVPRSVHYERLGASEGGVWVGAMNGGRVILYLGDPTGTDNSYLAVIREAKEPKTCLFEVRTLQVDRKGGVEFVVDGLEGESHACTIGVYGSYADGRIRFDHTIADEAAAIPPEVTLERSSEKANEEAVRLLDRFKRLLSEE